MLKVSIKFSITFISDVFIFNKSLFKIICFFLSLYFKKLSEGELETAENAEKILVICLFRDFQSSLETCCLN